MADAIIAIPRSTFRPTLPNVERFTAFVHETSEIIEARTDGAGYESPAEALRLVMLAIAQGHTVVIGRSFEHTRTVAEAAIIDACYQEG